VTIVAKKYRIISGDSHLDLPPERWSGRVPARWRDRAPRCVKLANGNDGIVVENRPVFTPTLLITGASYDKHDLGPITYDGAGTGPPEQRLREQEQDGVDAEILYTHPTYMSIWRGIRDDEPYKAMIRAYNDFLGEYAAAAPDRLIAMGLIPDTGLQDALAEMERCARLGLKGVCLYKFPSGKGYPTAEDDKFWQTALEMKMPLSAHTANGSTRFSREGPLLKYEKVPADAIPGRDPVNLLVRFVGEEPAGALQLAMAGVFDRFPTLRIYWAETQIGWLPYCLSQLDDTFERNRHWSERLWGFKPPERTPSDYLKTQNLWGFMRDPLGVRLRHDTGVGQLLWGSDFAHAAGDWPHSRKVIEECFAGVPEDECYRMLAGNVIEFFHLDA
jgi:predicted TIM-barrel fold metal-dependent hydrolase